MYLGILAGNPEEDPVGPGGGERGGGCQGVEALQGQDEQQREEGGEVFLLLRKFMFFFVFAEGSTDGRGFQSENWRVARTQQQQTDLRFLEQSKYFELESESRI